MSLQDTIFFSFLVSETLKRPIDIIVFFIKTVVVVTRRNRQHLILDWQGQNLYIVSEPMEFNPDDLLALENDVKLKIEHAFDVKHIYDIFATLISGMKHQQEQIRDLNLVIKVSNDKIAKMEKNIDNMEYNIQGFGSGDEEDPSGEARPVSRTRSSRKSVEKKEDPLELMEPTPEEPKVIPQEEPDVDDTSSSHAVSREIPEPIVTEYVVSDPVQGTPPPVEDKVEAPHVAAETPPEEKSVDVRSEEELPVQETEKTAGPLVEEEAKVPSRPPSAPGKKTRTPDEEANWQIKKRRILFLMHQNVKIIGRARREAMSGE
jgi:hypothetical protein